MFTAPQGPEEDSQRLYNSHVLVDSSGSIVSVYRKAHLFQCEIDGQVSLRESKWCIAGKEICPPTPSPAGNIGLMIVSSFRLFGRLSPDNGSTCVSYAQLLTIKKNYDVWFMALCVMSPSPNTSTFVLLS